MEIKEFVTARGRNLFRRWLVGLDRPIRERIQARVRRMGGGNVGKDRHLGGGLHEAKLDFGPGYRLYYGYRQSELILLLGGGDKSTQARDIALAGAHWRDYQAGGS
jgi:putative addiction module killer protein